MRRTAPWPSDFAYHYPQQGYYYQTMPQLYAEESALSPEGQAHSHGQQGYYYQPLYHCPTCGTPIYVVYVPVPQTTTPPNGLAALLIAVLVLLAVDILFLRRR